MAICLPSFFYFKLKYIFSFLFLIIIGYIGIILFHSDFILFLLGYIGKGRIFYLEVLWGTDGKSSNPVIQSSASKNLLVRLGKEIQLCVEEISREEEVQPKEISSLESDF